MQYKKGYRGKAFEWSTNAAELGSVDAHMQLSALYFMMDKTLRMTEGGRNSSSGRSVAMVSIP